MSEGLIEELGLGPEELIAVVGAGGKSTLLAHLGSAYAGRGAKVILTTTTKMGVDQISEPTCRTTDPEFVDSELVAGVPLFVVGGVDGSKVTGVGPEVVDRLFEETAATVVVVEADGARRKRFKAPAGHEPVIPSAASTVIVVAGAASIGMPISEAAHRPEIVADLADARTSDTLTPDRAARVLLHPLGGGKNVPSRSRLLYLVTAGPGSVSRAEALVDSLERRAPGVITRMWSLDDRGVDRS